MTTSVAPTAVSMVFTAMWDYSTNTSMTDPGARRFRANAEPPTQLAFGNVDGNSIDRRADLLALKTGDQLMMRSTDLADSWGTFVLVAPPVDLTTWVRLDVALTQTESAAGAPANNATVLFNFYTWSAEPEPDEYFPPPPASNFWNLNAVTEAAKKVLRVQTGDVDEERVLAAARTGTKLIDDYVDNWDPEPVTDSMFTAAVQLTVEVYRRKDAPFGVAGGWSTDSVPVFLSADVLKSAYALIRSDKERFGIA